MGTANGKTMEFAMLAGNRFGFLVNHIDKLAAKSSAKAACGAQLAGEPVPERLASVNLSFPTSFVAPRKDGAVAGGNQLPAPRQNNALRRRVRCCRCKNQRGWAREFLTGF